MAETILGITQCDPVAGTDRTRITFQGVGGTHTLEFTQDAIEALLPRLLAPPTLAGQTSVVSNAIAPVGCQPFESRQGLCGLAFNLGDRTMHVAVPANGIGHIRLALDAIESIYAAQKKP
jgi:hypothetical protein